MIVDRFEGDFAVCELLAGAYIRLERSRLGDTVREGDKLVFCGELFITDEETTKQLREEAADKLHRLFRRPPATL